MMRNRVVEEMIHKYYWEDEVNCATATIKILSEIFSIKISDDVIAAATGMHGAGGYGAQCGLVEGALMMTGIIGKSMDLSEEKIIRNCFDYAKAFESEFGSLLCKKLRPEGFNENQPPHLCEKLTIKAAIFSVNELEKILR